MSDWGAEELTEVQLEYAASDVLHLHKLRKALDDGAEQLRVSPIVFSEFRQWGVGTGTNLNDWVSLEGVAVSNAPGEKVFELPNTASAAGYYRGEVAFPSLDESGD
mgnify:CR=1 FL=1